MNEVIDNPASSQTATPPTHDDQTPKSSNKSFSNLPIAEQLLIAQRAYKNTSNNPQIGDVMLGFGYDRPTMETFGNLYTEAEQANILQTRENGDKVEAYTDFCKYYELVKAEYSNMRKFLRVALKKDNDKLVKLQVTESKKQTIGGLLQQVKFCYENVLADREVLDQLARIGISEKAVYEFKNNFDKANEYHVIYYKENSEAAEATRVRDEKVAALYDFISDFFVLAKIAFAKQPDLLKQIT